MLTVQKTGQKSVHEKKDGLKHSKAIVLRLFLSNKDYTCTCVQYFQHILSKLNGFNVNFTN